MFSNLDEHEAEIVIDAMEECKVPANDKIIQEGDTGDELYVVESGQLDCYKKIDGQDKMIKTYEPGEAFGELALLYNAPRAASIVSKTECLLWILDRQTFKHIVQDSAAKKRE